MTITDVRVFKGEAREDGSIFRGHANVTLDDAIAIHGISILDGKKGMFISFPSVKRGGVFKDIVHPVNQETRTLIQDAILAEYAKAE